VTDADRARASSMLPLGVAAVVGISVVVLIIILVIVDVSCYFVNSCGVTMMLCTRCGRSQDKTAEEGERYDWSVCGSICLSVCHVYKRCKNG